MTAIIVLIIGLIPTILKGVPGISDSLKQIIADVTASVTAIFSSGVVSQPGINTALAAWMGVITALKNDPNLPADSLTQIGQLEKIVQAVITEDAALALSVDWTKLNPITPLP